MSYMEDEKKRFIKKFKSDMRKSGYKLKIVNTFTGQCWDKKESKVFAVYYISYDEKNKPFIHQFFPRYWINNGLKWDKYIEDLFYCAALGMSRPMIICNAISCFMYGKSGKLTYTT